LRATIGRRGLKGTTMEHAEYRAYFIKRIAPRHDEKSTRVFVPENEERAGEGYGLVFYDAEHNRLGEI
jgi:hypothetical protein